MDGWVDGRWLTPPCPPQSNQMDPPQEHQKGYVLSRYDKPLKIYRRTLKEFQEATKVGGWVMSAGGRAFDWTKFGHV